MRSTRLSFILAAAVAGVATPMVFAEQPTYEQLQQQVAELQQQVDTLQNRTPRPTAAETDRVIDQMLSEADRRTQLLANDTTITAGYDKSFFIQSADGNFSLRPSLGAQFRYVANFNDGDADDESGFEFRRVRPRIDGNLFSPKLTYTFQFDVNRNGGDVTLLDAFVQYKFTDNWGVKLGQFKESVFHERDIGGLKSLAVEMSIADSLIGGGQTNRVQGIALTYGNKDNPLRAELAFHDGANSANTGYQDVNSNFGVGGRVEYKLAGDWADYRDWTARSTKKDLLVVGAGAELTQAGDVDVYRTTVDAQWELPSGLSVFGALHANFNQAGDDDTQDYGAVAQVAYAIDQVWEPFARYSLVAFDQEVNGQDTYNEIVGGVNYYLGPDGSWGSKAKITVDVVYLPDGAPSGLSGLGYVASDEDEFVFRSQFTLNL